MGSETRGASLVQVGHASEDLKPAWSRNRDTGQSSDEERTNRSTLLARTLALFARVLPIGSSSALARLVPRGSTSSDALPDTGAARDVLLGTRDRKLPIFDARRLHDVGGGSGHSAHFPGEYWLRSSSRAPSSARGMASIQPWISPGGGGGVLACDARHGRARRLSKLRRQLGMQGCMVTGYLHHGVGKRHRNADAVISMLHRRDSKCSHDAGKIAFQLCLRTTIIAFPGRRLHLQTLPILAARTIADVMPLVGRNQVLLVVWASYRKRRVGLRRH